MDWKIELVAIPVSDVDRAKAFSTEGAGFTADRGNGWAVQQPPARG